MQEEACVDGLCRCVGASRRWMSVGSTHSYRVSRLPHLLFLLSPAPGVSSILTFALFMMVPMNPSSVNGGAIPVPDLVVKFLIAITFEMIGQ